MPFCQEHFPLVVVHISSPVREVGNVLRAVLNVASDVED